MLHDRLIIMQNSQFLHAETESNKTILVTQEVEIADTGVKELQSSANNLLFTDNREILKFISVPSAKP